MRVSLLEHQMRFLEAVTFYVCLTGGYGSGKSSSCALKGVVNTMRDPGILHAIACPSIPQAKLSTIPSIFEVVEDWMGFKEGEDFEYNRTDHFFQFHRWGGQLVVVSGDDPRRLKGPNLGSFGMDEPGIQDYDVLKQGIARTRHPKAKHPQIYLCGTPEDLNWYSDFIEGDLKPADLTDIRAKTRDNFYLPEQFFRNMEESYTEQELKAYMHGQFVNLNLTQAYHAYGSENLIDASDFKPDPSLPLLLGFDYNWHPNTAIVAQEVPDWVDTRGGEPKKKLIVFDEFWITGNTETKCEAILQRYGTGYDYRIYQDATGDKKTSVGVSDLNLVANTFQRAEARYKVYYPLANPLRINRLNAVNGRLGNALGERFILITKNCKRLIDDLRKCQRDEYLARRFKDPDRGHITDCLGYLVHYRYPILRKINHTNKAVIV